MIVYAESSAVLSWLLGEENGDAIRRILADAQAVLASELTLIECERCLIRARVSEGMPEATSAERLAHLEQAATHWTVLTMGQEVVERARSTFPAEPVRTLDALHLATAIVARAAVADLAVLSLDRRVRDNALELDFEVMPLRSEIAS